MAAAARSLPPKLGAVLVLSLLWTMLAAAPAGADNIVVTPIIDQGVTIEVRRWVQLPDSSLGRPRLNMMALADDRTFVVEEYDGKIYEIVEKDGTPTPELFHDVKAGIAAATNRQLDNSSIFHGGLRSVAFHPDFAVNGLLYTSVMETRPTNPSPDSYLSDADEPVGADGVVIEWTYDQAQKLVDPLSYREVFRIGMPVYDHPIKQIAFNPYATPGSPDYGILYVGHGDGSVKSATAGGGQNADALGKVLRVDPRRDGADPYRVPTDNPFVNNPAMIDEVWSFGHRNPHHLSFTNAAGSVQLIVAEPGRDNVDELNIIERGGNFGWSEREGTFVHLENGGIIDGVAPLPADDAVNGYVYPAAQLGHDGVAGEASSGLVVAGGYVVDNGSALDGQYLYSYAGARGRIFHSTLSDLNAAVTSLDPNDPDRDSPADLTQATVGEASILFDHDDDPNTAARSRVDFRDVINDDPNYDNSNRADIRYGRGTDGEIYVLNKRNGWIYLITNSQPADPVGGDFACAKTIDGTDAVLTFTGTTTESANLRSTRWLATVTNADTYRVTNGANTDLTVRVRGDGYEDPYTTIPCTSAPVGGDFACAKTIDGTDAVLTFTGTTTESANLRSTRWLATVTNADTYRVTNGANTDLTVRVRGDGYEDPYTTIPCTSAPVGGDFACAKTIDGTDAVLTFTGTTTESANLRSTRWLATVTNADTYRVTNGANTDLTVRVRGDGYEDPYTTIPCT